MTHADIAEKLILALFCVALLFVIRMEGRGMIFQVYERHINIGPFQFIRTSPRRPWFRLNPVRGMYYFACGVGPIELRMFSGRKRPLP